MGLNPLAKDSAADPDGDHLTNIQEMRNNSDPLKWDNWLLLYGLYLLPVWISLTFCYIIILKMFNKFFKARQKGFKTHKEQRHARNFGFLLGDQFHTAKQSGFSTQEQWYEAVESGFPIVDEWFEAKVSGFQSLDQKVIAESIGFMNFHEFLDTLTRYLRKYKFRLNKLFSILVELDSAKITDMKKLQKYHKSIVDIIRINTELHLNLVLFTNVPTGDHTLSRDLRNEITRGDELLTKARFIASELLDKIRISS
ncbi:MAG: hypothetical protein GOP50_13055, partial [Candidatus Heimdallarchaeota archaeon]|nr:hypothetical protein [Candidatus Heimdallarchaeota archaeon]